MKKRKQKKRPSWVEYFSELVEIISKRSTCLRRQVGALIVKDKRMLATGYNGAPHGLAHCSEIGCMREEKKIPLNRLNELPENIIEQIEPVFFSNANWYIKNDMIYVHKKFIKLNETELIALELFLRNFNLKKVAIEINRNSEHSFNDAYQIVTSLFFKKGLPL